MGVAELEQAMKFTFVHIPRTGGNSLGKYLEGMFHSTGRLGHRHPRLNKIKNPQPPVITIVRNPWEWHVSWYHTLRGKNDVGLGELQDICRKFGFPTYIRCLNSMDYSNAIQYCYPCWQLSDWLQGHIDDILRTETLDEDVNKLLSKYGISRQITPMKISDSGHGPYQRYYTDRTKDIVARRHKDDIKRFGYEF